MMGAPTPATSKQDYGTPRAFLDAVEKRWGKISYDLAAQASNAVVPHYLTKEDNSLAWPWHKLPGLLWLNPPFKQCRQFAEKCAREAPLGAHILFLAPASVGTNWFWAHCAQFNVMPLSPRLAFDGSPIRKGKPEVFMKDLMLVEFGPNVPRAFDRWQWAK